VAGGGCYQVFTETASGARGDRPVLEQVLDRLRPGDTLVVWKLDRLGMELTGMVDTPGLQQGRRPRDRATAA
jgi:DNA invertase Pin-like site-specific DNA recombinase